MRTTPTGGPIRSDLFVAIQQAAIILSPVRRAGAIEALLDQIRADAAGALAAGDAACEGLAERLVQQERP